MATDSFSGAPWMDKRQQAQTETQETPFQHKKKTFFPLTSVEQWNGLPREVVASPSLEIVKT